MTDSAREAMVMGSSRQGVPGPSLMLCGLLLLPVMFGCERSASLPGPDPRDIVAERNMDDWTDGWKADWDELRVRVDPTLYSTGRPWVDGSRFALESQATVSTSQEGLWVLSIELSHPDQAGGVSIWFIPEDQMIISVDGQRAESIGGRLLISTLSWLDVSEIYFEFQVTLLVDGQRFYLRGAGSGPGRQR